MSTHTRIIAFASGKGGAGKTTMAVNIGLALASMGQKVCLLDADLGLSNVDLVMGLDSPSKTLEDVLFHDLPLEEVIVPVAANMNLIPGSSGISRMAELPREQRAVLVDEFKKLDGYDFLLIDNSPGLSRQVVSLCLSARELIVVVNPEVTSLVDAYALIKVLRENGLWSRPRIIVNRAESMGDAKRIFATLHATLEKYLNLKCSLLGVIPLDAQAKTAFSKQPFFLSHPHSPAARCTQFIAKRILVQESRHWKKGRPEEFWESTLTRIKQRPRFDLELSSQQLDTDLAAYAKVAPEELGNVLAQRAREMDGLASQLTRMAVDGTLAGQARTIAGLLDTLSSQLKEVVLPGEKDQDTPLPKMVVVSNQQEMRQILADMLAMLGYEPVAQLPSGVQEGGSVDGPCLGIVNVDRPEARIGDALLAWPGLPLVVLGGYGGTDVLRAFADRIVAVIPPPVTLGGLRSTLENLVGVKHF
ncbi:MinD/ParA family protein [Desulfoplanes formicivorans]|uniref:Cobyrinic acid ac-diamide synthase n=1 Tax=Desulfoplanes formicivorans TaxID=1592317 RepID=A0A194AED4_9BACT|nr:MinD/ParA family protein [Desulfoplanes formicivorans]GAU07688.1 cobyrinic acid ac-diamide synthase [Desulfoplanes formicivorans]